MGEKNAMTVVRTFVNDRSRVTQVTTRQVFPFVLSKVDQELISEHLQRNQIFEAAFERVRDEHGGMSRTLVSVRDRRPIVLQSELETVRQEIERIQTAIANQVMKGNVIRLTMMTEPHIQPLVVQHLTENLCWATARYTPHALLNTNKGPLEPEYYTLTLSRGRRSL